MEFTVIVNGKNTFLGLSSVERFFNQRVNPELLEKVEIPVKYLRSALINYASLSAPHYIHYKDVISYLVNKCKASGITLHYREISGIYYTNINNSNISDLILSLCSDEVTPEDMIVDSIPFHPEIIFKKYSDELEKMDPSYLLFLANTQYRPHKLKSCTKLLISFFKDPIPDNHGALKYFLSTCCAIYDPEMEDYLSWFIKLIKKGKIVVSSAYIKEIKGLPRNFINVENDLFD